MDDVSELTLQTMHATAREDSGVPYPNGPVHFKRPAGPRVPEAAKAEAAPVETPPTPAIDFWTVLELLVRRWYWMFLGGLLLAIGGYFAGQRLFLPSFTATARLLRIETDNLAEFYKVRQLTPDTFASIAKSPELLQAAARRIKPPMTADALAGQIDVSPASQSDLVEVTATADVAELAVSLANFYAQQVVAYTKQLQAKDAAGANDVMKKNLAAMDADVRTLNKQLEASPRTAADQPLTQAAKLIEKLQAAQDDLDTMLVNKTYRHPDVIEQTNKINVLERKLKEINEQSQAAANPARPQRPGGDSELIRSQLANLNASYYQLVTRQREAQYFAGEPPGYCQLFAPAKLSEVKNNAWEMKTLFLALVAGALGVGCALAMVLAVEFMDERLKTTEDLKRVSRLPLLATLGDTHRMSATAQTNWAFRTWTAFQSRLSPSPNHGLVCGFISCRAGEGRSTWINLLAQAASQCGFRVLTIGTVRMPEKDPGDPEQPASAAAEEAAAPTETGQSSALMLNVLSAPMQVTQKLTSDDPTPFVHIPLPGWVWNLERRKQWQEAMVQWRTIQNVAIFVELPPAAENEAVLLAANLPNLVWLARSGYSRAAEARAALQTLRDARCRLVGCALNNEPGPPMKRRFARWFACGLMAVGLWSLAGPRPALGQVSANTNRPPADTRVEPAEGARTAQPLSVTNVAFSFSALEPSQRAEWQKRLTLGPGDVLNFGFFGHPELERREVSVGPDGRVSFLQALDIPVTGLTVDELRAKLEEELTKFWRTPRVIITPVAYHSKKYYVLGRVINRGVYLLDRPVTIIEAVARAHGLETGLLDNQNLTDLADLQRSFLMRRGQRVPVNFEKLFQEGDLSQNIALEPEDYLFFAAWAVKEVYVLGEVRNPGPVPYTPTATVLTVIAERGGYTERAFKSRVLVLRGSLNKPQTFVVDTWAALDARGLDFKLAPKDIVFIHARPFIYVEDLLDLAATAFIQSAVSAWTGENIGPIITEPFLPKP